MGNCLITRRGGGGGGTTPSLPTGYTSIDYVGCGLGSYGQSGFIMRNCVPKDSDIIEIISTTPTNTTTESAFMGLDGTSGEAYYQSNEVLGYGAMVKVSNTETQIEGNITKNTTVFTINRSGYYLVIGYYRTNSFKYQGRIYSVTVSRPIIDVNNTATGQNVILHNFVPCYRNSDNVVGLFDLIQQVFYPSQSGIDPFTAPA